MRNKRSPRAVDLSADMLDSTTIQESFLLGEDVKRKLDLGNSEESSLCKVKRSSSDETADENFLLHCTSPISRTSTITMDLLSPASSVMSDDSCPVIAQEGAPMFPSLMQEMMTPTSMVPPYEIPPVSNSKGPTTDVYLVDEDCFTYVTLAESKSSESSGDVVQGIFRNGGTNKNTTSSIIQTPAYNTSRASTLLQTPCYSIQTPYTYETIDESCLDVNRTGIRTQYTFETIQTTSSSSSTTAEKENTPNRKNNSTTASSRKKYPTKAQSSPLLEGRRIYSVSPLATTTSDRSASRTPTRKRNKPKRVDLDCFSVDEYASSPDKSVDCFSVDSYASSADHNDDDGLGFGGAGVTALDLARTKRDQSLFRLRFLGGETFQSPSRPTTIIASPSQNSARSGCGGDATSSISSIIQERKDHVEKQRRRLSQVVHSYCQSTPEA